MGRILTQSRVLSDSGTRKLKLAHWANIMLTKESTRSVQQTTTSFRSGSRAGDQFVVGESTALSGRFAGAHDNGHEFDTISTRTNYSHRAHRLSSADKLSYWEGVMLLDLSGVSSTFAEPTPWDLTQAAVTGSRFIRLTKPTAPSASLATSIGELWADKKIASFVGSATLSNKLSTFQKAGSEYLNVVFGWVPFVTELTKVLNAVGSSEKIISQFVRDSGRIVRRKRSFDTEYVHQPVQSIPNRSLAFPIDGAYIEPSAALRSGTLTIHEWTSTKYSFSAAYTYYIETGGNFFTDIKRFEQLANKLLGTRITPEVLWELVPFSWLVDWMWSTGTYVSNYSSFNGDELVLKYGYVMRQQESWRQCSLPGLTIGGQKQGTFANVFSSIRKSRVRSTPYGFGQNPASFTGSQWAILAALGMTRSPNKLIS